MRVRTSAGARPCTSTRPECFAEPARMDKRRDVPSIGLPTIARTPFAHESVTPRSDAPVARAKRLETSIIATLRSCVGLGPFDHLRVASYPREREADHDGERNERTHEAKAV